jgi:hypothetical protein
MPNRILREGINDSERVNALSPVHAELFYRKLMSLCDDFGRFEANPAVLLGKLYALRPTLLRSMTLKGLPARVLCG